MLVRRYVVRDMPEAVVMIRKDLGKEAVILSSKRIRVKKWWGLWHTKRIEVLAATGEDVPKRAPHRHAEPERLAETPVVMNELSAAAEVSTAETFNEQVDSTVKTVHSATDGWFEMKREVAEIRALLQQTMGPIQAELPRLSTQQEVVRQLIQKGVDSSTAVELCGNAITEEEALDNLLSALSQWRDAKPIQSTSRVCAFVGPTGVGKTTTVAKIAALHVLAGNRKVGLITADTYRIAAVEQLKTYASILHVPLQVVQSPADFPAALDRLDGCDLVLVDTAGRSYRTREHVEEVQHLLSNVKVDETILVMSMTSKPDDLLGLTKLFLHMHIDKFLFTKMDETESYGVILTLLHQYQKPLSYVTTGQNVPDDIEIPTLDKLVRLLVGGVA